MDAIVVHSEHGAARLRDELGLDPATVHVIPHGVLDNLAATPPVPLFAKTKPVVLFFGLIRPYKGLDVLLEAWREANPDAELWVVGMPRMDVSFVHGPNVRTALRFVSGAELAGAFAAADLVVLPYREIDQSGVLFTALAFGKPLLLSAVGGFREIEGAELVAPGDPHALAQALTALLGDPERLARMAAASRATADGRLQLGPDRSAHARALRGAPGVDGAHRRPGRLLAGRRPALPGVEEPGPLRHPPRHRVVLVDQQLDQRQAQLVDRPVAQQRHRA